MQKTYFQKLKDPRWQKKRLEVLEKNDWVCERCMNGEATLHVHHRQYFKGREPWEYEAGQLAVLCEYCHEVTHEEEDALLLACSYCVSDGPFSRDTAASVVAGFTRQSMSAPYVGDPHAYLTGVLAQQLAGWQKNALTELELDELNQILDHDLGGFTAMVRDYLKKSKGEA